MVGNDRPGACPSLLLPVVTVALAASVDAPSPAPTDRQEARRLARLARAEAADEVDEVVDVEQQRPVEPPCRTILDRTGVRSFPARDPTDLAAAVPGMWIGSHLGRGGPADWAWRGFDAGQGRDLEVTVWDVPINEPGSVLGGASVDLSFLPKQLVQGLSLCPGATAPQAGPYATAGTLAYHVGLPRPGWWGRLGAGTDSSGQLTAAWWPRSMPQGTFAIAEAEEGQGVGTDQGWRHLRLAGAVEGNVGRLHGGVIVALHDGGWDVPPELRQDDLDDDTVKFRGSYRFWSSRAASRRLLVAAKVSRPWDWGAVQAIAWFGLKGLRIVDDRTGLLFDATDGDGTDQRQSTVDSGLRASVSARFHWLGDETRIDAGAELRGTSQRQRLTAVDLLGDPLRSLDDVRAGTFSASAWAGVRIGMFGRASLEPTLRVVGAQVSRGDLDDDTLAKTQGFALLPKVALVVRPNDAVRFDASWSRGWRPPSPQFVVTDAPLAPTWVDTFELDVGTTPIRQLQLQAQGFVALGRNERIVDLLTGDLLASGTTRRVGGELSATGRPFDGLAIVADAAFADARLVGTQEALPYAPRTRVATSLVAEDRVIGPIVLTGSLRFQWTGGRTLPGGFRAQDVWTLDLASKIVWKRWTFDVRVENLAPWNWHSAEFVHPSRWDVDDRATALPVRHVVAGRPFALTLGVSRWF